MKGKEQYRPLPPLLQKRLEHIAEEIKREQLAASKTDAVIIAVLLVAFFATLVLIV